jgi:hypothetical protein
MTVLPFDPDARLLGVLLPLFMIAGALAIGLLLRIAIDRFLEEGIRAATTSAKRSSTEALSS